MNPNKRRRLAGEAEQAGKKYFDLGEYHASKDVSLKQQN